MAIVRVKATDGSEVAYEDKIIGAGGMKDVYFGPDKSYVVGWFRKPADAATRDRLQMITGTYREAIFNGPGGDYWKDLYCWPTKMVTDGARVGIVAPAYAKHFFFEHGSKNDADLQAGGLGIKGKEKEGTWFASVRNRTVCLDPRERGDWRSCLGVCLLISRAVRRLHASGLSHSDLSAKNVLIDPVQVRASLIDLDSLVVPGKYPPEVVGTPDFIAPEVMATQRLPRNDPKRRLPSIATDRHALATMCYMLLLGRHPLRGGKIFSRQDDREDESLRMGAQAIWIENDADRSNRYDLTWIKDDQGKKYSEVLPWWDLDRLPYTILGPLLADCCKRAFTEGLHNPDARPTADEWEAAFMRTMDLIQPCQNPSCTEKWFVFDSSTAPACPFCGKGVEGQFPLLDLYSRHGAGATYGPDRRRVVVYPGAHLYRWHVDRQVTPDERLADADKKPVAYFILHQGRWLLVNHNLPALKDLVTGKVVTPGQHLALESGQRIQFSPDPDGRVAVVRWAGRHAS